MRLPTAAPMRRLLYSTVCSSRPGVALGAVREGKEW